MAFTRPDLDALDVQIQKGVKKVTFADGRSREFQSVSEMMELRREMKAEIVAAESQITPRTRFSLGRMRRRGC